MPVRIKIRLKPLKGKSSELVETSAIANAGYESVAPQILALSRLARRLAFLPKPPKEARKETFVGAVGTARMHLIPDALGVTAVTGEVAEPGGCSFMG